MIKVVVDAMGGDYAPGEIVKGCVAAIGQRADIQVILTGQEELINEELSKHTYNKEQIQIVHTSEVISTEGPGQCHPQEEGFFHCCRHEPGETRRGRSFVSAGSSGAILVGGQTIVGRIKGVERPPLAPLIPTEKGVSLLVDCGANVDARPSHLVQFAQMGSIYMKHVMGIENPRVAIVNIGAEEEKGNALVKETFPLLKACEDINFIGSIEAREIPHGGADVIVCEAFTGNVILKLYEGVGATLISKVKSGMMTSLRSKIGALLVKPALKETLKSFDASQYGGAPLLGLNGLVVKTHGNSKAKEVCNSIIQCVTFKEQGINEKIRESLGTQKNEKEE
ncbi:MAG: phosphate acyltransferase PlsX [Lachnospiraceae bacterium]